MVCLEVYLSTYVVTYLVPVRFTYHLSYLLYYGVFYLYVNPHLFTYLIIYLAPVDLTYHFSCLLHYSGVLLTGVACYPLLYLPTHQFSHLPHLPTAFIISHLPTNLPTEGVFFDDMKVHVIANLIYLLTNQINSLEPDSLPTYSYSLPGFYVLPRSTYQPTTYLLLLILV